MVGARRGVLRALGHVPPGLGHGGGLLLLGHLRPVELHVGDAGQRPDPGPHVALDLGPERAAGGGEGDGDDHLAVGLHAAPLAMPSSTMSLPSSGSMTPRRTSSTSSGVGRGVSGTTGFYRREPCKLHERCPTRSPLLAPLASSCSRRWATTPATPSTSSWPGRRRRWPPRRSPTPWACTPTPCAPTSTGCARSACSRWSPTPRARSGRPQHRYSLAADAPSLGFEPPAFPVLARMLLRLAATAGAAGRRRRRRRPGAGRRRRRPPSARRHLRRGARRRARRARLRPRVGGRRAAPPPSPSPTARSGSWPRPTRSSCAACTEAWWRASSTLAATARWSTSTTWPTAIRARSRSPPSPR